MLAGFTAFFDPPMPGVAEALQALRRDGVAVKILTGDSELVAAHVCEQVGLDGGQMMLGEEIEALGDMALGAVAERTAVFARVSPAQKHRIILALKHRGHAVGFLGDGINDAPSLHAADVGISVANAVDVAKDAADIILRERRLDVLHSGIVEGRKAFANVLKYLWNASSPGASTPQRERNGGSCASRVHGRSTNHSIYGSPLWRWVSRRYLRGRVPRGRPFASRLRASGYAASC